MKISQSSVFIVIFLFFGAALSAESPFLEKKTPVQSYESLTRPAKPTTAPKSQTTTAVPTFQAIADLHSKLTRLTQTTRQYQAQLNLKTEQLFTRTRQLQEKTQHLTTALLMLNQQVALLAKKVTTLHPSQQKTTSLTRYLNYLPLVALGILAVLLGLFISRHKKEFPK